MIKQVAESTQTNGMRLFKRQSAGPPPDQGNSTAGTDTVIVVVTIIILIIFSITSYFILKILRVRHANPKFIPTKYLKRTWENWQPKGLFANRHTGKGTYAMPLGGGDGDAESIAPTLHLRSENRSARASTLSLRPGGQLNGDGDVERGEGSSHAQDDQTAADAGVNRQTSVRSVMTLPAYSHSVRASERVIGREGERAGIDVVIEAPETNDEEESRRDAEMESLYQIRLQRRIEIEEREDRRRRRREARERGDYAALAEIRAESERAAQLRELSGAAALIADHQSRPRERRISSVDYAEVGIARHDGSRVRCGSRESGDRRPLLDEPMGMGMGGIRAPWAHTRGRSTGSFGSLHSGISDVSTEIGAMELEPPPFGRAGNDYEIVTLNSNQSGGSRSHSRSPSFHRMSVSGRRSRASSGLANRPLSLNTSTFDLGEATIPTGDEVEPPGYDLHAAGFEDAPPYTSPIQERAPQPFPSLGQDASTQGNQEPGAPPRPASLSNPTPSAFPTTGAPLLPEIIRLPSIRVAVATPVEITGGVPFPDF
ncbi:Hypothetical protein R9X50_00145300 [Acrodontium crateriforme]|uniref:Uncharacterized protein n=1 Tax=Acrodontium crateriforme TaxID=150365 RepID=A0AAQ3M2H8_9PEZI|nr:Hypothetical protein R9X50_00145300 [Acrodontium crateriforme]